MTKAITKEYNLQQLFCDTRNAGNMELFALIDEAWETCEEIDYHAEWGDNTVGSAIYNLATNGHEDIAQRLADALGFEDTSYDYHMDDDSYLTESWDCSWDW